MSNFFKPFFVWAFALTAFAFTACDDNEVGGEEPTPSQPVDYVLNAQPDELNFIAEGESKVFTVTAQNVEWTATVNAEGDWLTLSQSTGTASAEVTVTAEANPDDTDRTGTIVLTAEHAESVTITVEQVGAIFERSLSVDEKDLSLEFVSALYRTREIKVSAEHADWIPSTESDWIELEKAGNDLLIVTVVLPDQARNGEIVLAAKGVEPVTITVAQSAASDIIGTYVPYIPDPSNPIGEFILSATYLDGMGPLIEGIESVLGPELAGYEYAYVVFDFARQIIGGIYAGGLVDFTLNQYGSFDASIHELLNFSIGDGAVFSDEIYHFPDTNDPDEIPANAIGYYTQDGMIYLTVDKAFLTAESEAAEIDNLVELISGLLESNGLQEYVVSTDEYFAIPLKYEMNGDQLKIYIDRDMMMPFIPMITGLLEAFVPEVIEINMDPSAPETLVTIEARKLVLSLINAMFTQSTSLEIGLVLQKQM